MSSRPNFKIRTASKADIDTIIQGQMTMAMESEGLQLQKDSVSKGVNAVFNDPNKGTYWIAESEDGRIAGSLLCIPEWSDWRNATVLWVNSVYTWPDFRKQGVYKTLYEYLKSKAEKDPDIAGIRLYVDKNNHSADAVYQKLGMSSEHYRLYEWLKAE